MRPRLDATVFVPRPTNQQALHDLIVIAHLINGHGPGLRFAIPKTQPVGSGTRFVGYTRLGSGLLVLTRHSSKDNRLRFETVALPDHVINTGLIKKLAKPTFANGRSTAGRNRIGVAWPVN